MERGFTPAVLLMAGTYAAARMSFTHPSNWETCGGRRYELVPEWRCWGELSSAPCTYIDGAEPRGCQSEIYSAKDKNKEECHQNGCH